VKENLKRKENVSQKRRYTIEDEENSNKRQRTDGFADHEESHSFAKFLARGEEEETSTVKLKPVMQPEVEAEKLHYVEGEKGELQTKAAVLQAGKEVSLINCP
jgi:hypothetical protein